MRGWPHNGPVDITVKTSKNGKGFRAKVVNKDGERLFGDSKYYSTPQKALEKLDSCLRILTSPLVKSAARAVGDRRAAR